MTAAEPTRARVVSAPGLRGHRAQLDGLRAIAVGCVILYHWSEVAWPTLFRLLPWGDIGSSSFSC